MLWRWVSFMLSVIIAECRTQAHYAECRYVECSCAECRGALNNFKVLGFTPNPTPAPSHLQQNKHS